MMSEQMSNTKKADYRVALEGFEGSVAAEATHVDTHISAAGGKGGVVLPVDIERRGCGTFKCTWPQFNNN